jgi:ribosome-associated heat shock protein Hsp15
MNKVRVDKWLWAVRIFKSRSKASDACRSGKVKIGDQVLKASHEISVGNLLQVRKEGFNLSYKVLDLIDKRVSATLAAPCYENLTPAEELNKYKDWFIGKSAAERRLRGTGRPTKRERRELDDFKNAN